MEKTNLGYSTKNIPVAPNNEYLKRLIEMTEHLTRRMRWKAFFHLNPDARTNNQQNFGFNSRKPAPTIKELTDFETAMTKLIQTIKFRQHHNRFQTKLKHDLLNLRNEDRLLVKADKTTNYYKLGNRQYNDLLTNNVTTNYKKTNADTKLNIAITDKAIAKSLNIDDRVERLAERNAFITLKDHKANFNNRPTCRLINPCKSEIGKISKRLLEDINKKLTKTCKLNIWRNTKTVIDWFKNIQHPKEYKFIIFDVCDFYPSITKTLLDKALDFASLHTTITPEHRHIITHAKSALLFHNDNTWTKSNTDSTFDVTMGSFDGAETCELIGTYLLSLLPDNIRHNIGLYRDDGLAICKESPRDIENMKKTICKTFKDNDLRITIEANKTTVDFLDVTLNLTDGTHKPYMKPDNTILYVHTKSNHPPNIIKQLPTNINKRLSDLSSSKREFDNAAPTYQKALHNSGYKYQLEYQPPTEKNKRNRHRNVTWYNPPYNANLQTNLGKQFLKIIDSCFTHNHPLHKIFNRKTIKLSYSCMPNMKRKIDTHNMQTLKNNQQQNDTRPCNCRIKADCPLDGKCLTKSVVYQATVTETNTDKTETYVGLCETDFKARYYNHRSTFKHENKQNNTELSKHIWHPKNNKTPHKITWKIIQKARIYNSISKRCQLCTLEKFIIITQPEKATLNKRNELVSQCRHSRNYLLNS